MKKNDDMKSTQKYARIAGFMLLFTVATAAFANSFVRSKLIVWGNAGETARNIMAAEGLFRMGIASDLICFTSIIILHLALYRLLKSTSPDLAILGLFWRLGEAIILGINAINAYVVLQLLSGADYLAEFETAELFSLSQLFINMHGNQYFIGLIFFSLGSIVFNFLWFRSGYIPKPLAAWGIFASLVAFSCTFIILVLPAPPEVLYRFAYLPIFIDEVVLGFWLLLKGVRVQEVVKPAPYPQLVNQLK